MKKQKLEFSLPVDKNYFAILTETIKLLYKYTVKNLIK